jgi:hypothetical protein
MESSVRDHVFLHIRKLNYLEIATTTPAATSKHPTIWLMEYLLLRIRVENANCQTK